MALALALVVAPTAFASESLWTTPVTGNQPIDPRSGELVAGLVNTVNDGYADGRPPWIAVRKCAARIYTVPADQRTVPVALLNGALPARASLQSALSAVPLPDDAVPSDCPDAVIIVEQPSTDRMWELWHARHDTDGWRADWGGATEHMSTNIGSYGPSDWTGALPTWGASASSLTLAPGVMRTAELARGEIDHAIALSLPQTAAKEWAWPAERTDGASTSPDALPYGAHLRLAPSVNVDAMNVPAAAKVILHAIQTYGLVVREQTHYCVQLAAEAAPADDPDFYERVLGGYAGTIMRAIPWSDMQVLRMDLRTKAGPVVEVPQSDHQEPAPQPPASPVSHSVAPATMAPAPSPRVAHRSPLAVAGRPAATPAHTDEQPRRPASTHRVVSRRSGLHHRRQTRSHRRRRAHARHRAHARRRAHRRSVRHRHSAHRRSRVHGG